MGGVAGVEDKEAATEATSTLVVLQERMAQMNGRRRLVEGNPLTPKEGNMVKGPQFNVRLTGGVLVLLGVLVLAAVAGLTAITQVERGTVGVVTRFGAVTGRIMDPGLNFKIPFFIEQVVTFRTLKITYEASDQPGSSAADYVDYSVDTVTRDGQRIQVNYTIRFRVDATQAAWVAQNLGTEARIVENIVKTESRILARNVPKEFAASDLYTGNIIVVQERIFELLAPTYTANGLILDLVGLRSIIFTTEYAQAIENKQIALEGVVTARNLALQAEHQAQAIENLAEGTANALRIEGAALREYPEVLTLRFVDKLADDVEVWFMNAEQNVIFDLGKVSGLGG